MFGRFVPGVDPARVFASMERRRGALGTFTFDEIMVHLCHYAGSPKAVDGMRAVRAAFAEIRRTGGRAGPALKFKLLATDLDGTLLDRSGAIHERDRRAIAELQRRGVAVTIVTGRMYSGTRDLARGLLLDGPIGCLDGSAIVAVREDRHLVSRALAGEAGRVLRATLAGGSPAVFILGHEEIFHDARGVPFTQYVRGWTSRVTRIDGVTAAPHWETEAGVAGVIAVGTKEEIEALVSGLAPAAALVAPVAFPVSRDGFAGHWAMVARAAGATKGSALQWIAAHHGIDVSEVVTVVTG